jgi:hypothetical protein
MFGPYLLEVENNHAVIRREDDEPCEPTFYELQHIKNMAFGGDATAIEVFPSHVNLVDGQHQRHLWQVDENTVPNLRTGNKVGIKIIT